MEGDVRGMFTVDDGAGGPAVPTPSLAVPSAEAALSKLSARARQRAQVRRVHARSAPATIARKLRAELVAHVGGNPTAVQKALIDTAYQLRLKLAVFDARFVELCGFSDHGRREYLAFVNSFCRVLDRLGFAPAPEPRPSIADHLAGAP